MIDEPEAFRPPPSSATVLGGPLDGTVVAPVNGTHVEHRVVLHVPANLPGDPFAGTLVEVVYVYHLYQDGTYRPELPGQCPAPPT